MFRFEADHGPYLMERAPLVRAVAQVVFPPSARLATADGLAALQDQLGEGFARQAQTQQVLHTTCSRPPAPIPQRHVFAEDAGYTLAVTPQDLALSIDQRYRSRLSSARSSSVFWLPLARQAKSNMWGRGSACAISTLCRPLSKTL